MKHAKRLTMRTRYIVLFIVATASSALAQDTVVVAPDTATPVRDANDLAPGTRVRTVAIINDCFHPERTVGHFRGIEHEAVQIDVNRESGITAIPLRSIREISVSAGAPSRTAGARRGAIWGSAVGAIAGYFLFPRTIRIRQNPVEVNDYSHALFGGLIVGGFGASVGWNFPTERWQRVSLPRGVTYSPECPYAQPIAR